MTIKEQPVYSLVELPLVQPPVVARQVYTAVVRPAMTYRAAIWYSPREIRERGTAHVGKLKTQQNQCLRLITGAFKATKKDF